MIFEISQRTNAAMSECSLVWSIANSCRLTNGDNISGLVFVHFEHLF